MHLELLNVSSADIIPIVEMSAFLRVDDPTQNAEIARLVKAAITKFQEWTGRQCLTATYKMTLRSFPRCWGAIRIPKPPFSSITSVGYYATAGTLTYLAETTGYQVAKGDSFYELWPPTQGFWPSCAPGLANGVEIVFTCGYGVQRDSFDEDLIHSLKVLVAHWYENREAGDLPDFIINLWQQWHTGEQG